MKFRLRRRDFLMATTALAADIVCPAVVWADGAGTSSRQRQLLDRGWRFFAGDIAFPEILTQDGSYDNAKAGKAGGAAAISYDDSAWQSVQLPHDFVSFQPIEPQANPAQGYRKRGIAWYRNTLYFPAEDQGKQIELQIGAAATLATVWFNGTVVAHNYSGYNAITIDLTPFVVCGDAPNTLAVRVDANAMEGWWYEGGGLYRDVYIVKRNAVAIATDGLYANPVPSGRGWTIPAEITISNMASKDQSVTVVVELRDADGRVCATQTAAAVAAAMDATVVSVSLEYDRPKLWSPDDPHLYRVCVRLQAGDACLDETDTTCGFRTLRFDPDHGFYLNGQALKIQGVCLHQDHAGVGTAIPDALWEYRLRRLKALGCNAVRCSHNAPSAVMLDLCDRYGLLVMDENRQFNPSPDYMAELTWMVRRDRNHPCVILWSVFNEEPMQGTSVGREMVRRMVHAVKALDRTRPVTAAMNSGYFNPDNVSQVVDVVGFNYNHKDYDAFHAAHPDLPMISSEDTSAFMMRGEYDSDATRHQIDSYDDQIGIDTHREAWQNIAKRDFVAGGFVWTGFDYHGEPKPGYWPTNSSNFGILDLCGFDKAAAYIHQAQWVKSRPVLKVVPHWNWPGREGKPVKVMVMSNLEDVEVLLNGRSLGRQKADPFAMNAWNVAYAPGVLEAIGYRGGKIVSRTRNETTGAAVALTVVPDRSAAAADGRDTVAFQIAAVDAQGRTHPLANPLVNFSVHNGEIIGLGNGDPNSLEAEKGARRSLYHGLAQVIVRTNERASGALVLTATAPGLRTAQGSVRLLRAALPDRPRVGPSVQLLDWWYEAPATGTAAESLAKFLQDMQPWPDFGGRGLLDPLPMDGYCLCSCAFTPHVGVQAQGGIVDFSDVAGACAIYDGQTLIAQKKSAMETPLTAVLMPLAGKRRLNVLFRVEAGKPFGFRKDVMVKPLQA